LPFYLPKRQVFIYFESLINTNGNPIMAKDTEKTKTLPVPLTEGVRSNLNRIQAERQLKDGHRTSLKAIATEILENAKA
jgi:hypothetical protein